MLIILAIWDFLLIIMVILGNVISIRTFKQAVCEDWEERLRTISMGLALLVLDIGFIVGVWLQLRHI